MARQIINTGNVANDNTGDSLRVAFTKANENFQELFTYVGGSIGDLSSNGTLMISGTLNSAGNTYIRTGGLYFQDTNDLSKQVQFDISGHPNGTISSLTLPSGITSLLSPESVATLSNKIIDGSVNTFRNVPLGDNNVTGTLGVTRGGTGVATVPDAGQILIGTGTTFKLAQLTPGAGIEIDNSSPGAITISSSQSLDSSAVQEIVQQMFTDNGSVGIVESFDPTNRKINLYANDFNIQLTGDVTGDATVRGLGDVKINTSSTSLIKGITTLQNNYPTGDAQSVKQINFTGAVNVSQNGDKTTINVPTPITQQTVRDVVGDLVQGTITDAQTGLPTDSGVIVYYDQVNQTLELGVREFNIALTGEVSGIAKVSRLKDVTIETTTTALKGLSLKKEGLLVGYTNTVKAMNFVGISDLVVDSNGEATITVSALSDPNQIKPIVGDMLTGIQYGINASYNSTNKNIDFSLKPIKINLAGAVVGTGNVSFTGGANDGIVTINTEASIGGGAGGVTVADEYNVTGQVTELNFVGGGITTAVSVDGQVATVYVPNSPAAENFILATDGSENVQNSRRFTAGTGIAIVDEGPGGRFIVSAASDSILAKSDIFVEGVEIGQEIGIDIYGSQEIVVQGEDDPDNNKVKLTVYSLADGWYRKPNYDCGDVTDKYGSTLDMGDFTNKIINYAADLGTL